MRLLAAGAALATFTAAAQVETASIQMDVAGGEIRCLGDTLRKREGTSFGFRTVPTEGRNNDDVQVRVAHPSGEVVKHELGTTISWREVPSDEEGGTYNVCFHNMIKKGSARVELKEKTLSAPHGPNEHVEPHLEPVYQLLQRASASAVSLLDQLHEGKASESERVEGDRVLRSRINSLASFTVVMLVSVSAWQLLLLNRFFRSKKLI